MYAWLQRLFSSQSEKTSEIHVPPDEAFQAAPAPHRVSTTSWMQRDGINAQFTEWLFESNDGADLFTNQLEKDILAAVEDIVKSKQSGANLVRRMPGVIPQLLNSLRTEYFSGKELAAKISHDVVLVAAVIRLANSSLHKTSKAITSIEHAVLVLGQGGLRHLITSVAFQPIIDLKSGQYTRSIAPRIWEQSERCAIANRLLANEDGVDPFETFLAGLIQNVGLIVSLRLLDQMADGKQPIGSSVFCNSLLGYARTLSCSIGKEWHFPESVTSAIAEQGNNYNMATMSSVGKILSMGDYLSKMQMLISQERLSRNDANLTKGLSATELNCLKELELHVTEKEE